MYSLWWQSEIERREFGNFQVVVLALMQFHEPANTLMFSLSAEFVLQPSMVVVLLPNST